MNTELTTSIGGKTSSTHTYVISDITSLQTTLDGKTSSTHTHIMGDITIFKLH